MKDLKQIEQYTSYTKYKDSGIEWLGKIPEHWKVSRIEYVANKTLNSIDTKDMKGKELFYYDIPTVQSVNDGRLENGDNIESNKYKLKGGEVLISKLNPRKKTVVLTEKKKQDIVCSTEFVPFYPKKIMGKYLYYILSNSKLADYYNSFVKSATNSHQRVEPAIISKTKIPVPPLDEQRLIADFLDYKTSQIDAIIKEKEQLIEHLQEYRQAIINEAVTKGLSPETTKMKDSGVDGIGEIPKHWTIERLKYFVKMIGGGTPSKENKDFWDGEIPWVSPKDMKSDFIETTEDKITWEGLKNSSTTLIEREAVLVVIRSGILKHSLPVAINKIPVTLNQDMKALISQRYVKTEYLAWLLKGLSAYILFNCKKIGATVDSIEIEYLNMLQVPIPPMEEQISIIKYLKKHTESINNLIKEVNYQIEKLREYRESLICEAVTGKIDVRGFRKGE